MALHSKLFQLPLCYCPDHFTLVFMLCWNKFVMECRVSWTFHELIWSCFPPNLVLKKPNQTVLLLLFWFCLFHVAIFARFECWSFSAWWWCWCSLCLFSTTYSTLFWLRIIIIAVGSTCLEDFNPDILLPTFLCFFLSSLTFLLLFSTSVSFFHTLTSLSLFYFFSQHLPLPSFQLISSTLLPNSTLFHLQLSNFLFFSFSNRPLWLECFVFVIFLTTFVLFFSYICLLERSCFFRNFHIKWKFLPKLSDDSRGWDENIY